jgi:hypothetical protein
MKSIINGLEDARIDRICGADYPGAGMNILQTVRDDWRAASATDAECSADAVACALRYIFEGVATLDEIAASWPRVAVALRMLDLGAVDLSDEASTRESAMTICRALGFPVFTGENQTNPPPQPPRPGEGEGEGGSGGGGQSPEGERCPDCGHLIDSGHGGHAGPDLSNARVNYGWAMLAVGEVCQTCGHLREDPEGDEEGGSEGEGEGDDEGGSGGSGEGEEGDDEEGSEGAGGSGDEDEGEGEGGGGGDGEGGGEDEGSPGQDGDGDGGGAGGSGAGEGEPLPTGGVPVRGSVEDRICEEIARAIRSQPRSPMVTDPRIEKRIRFGKCGGSKDDVIERISASMMVALRQAIQTRTFGTVARQDRGTLDARRIADARMGSRYVMKRRSRTPGIDAAVYLTVDISGSMAGVTDLARDAISCLNRALGLMDIPLHVEGYHGSGYTPTYYVMKEWGERWNDADVRARIDHLHASGGTPTDQALFRALDAMRDRPEGVRLIVLATDGNPATLGSIPDSLATAQSEGIQPIIVGMNFHPDEHIRRAMEGFYTEVQSVEDLGRAALDFITDQVRDAARMRGG